VHAMRRQMHLRTHCCDHNVVLSAVYVTHASASIEQEEEARICAADAEARALLAEATTAEQRLAAARRGVRDATAELGGARAQGRALRTQITRLADQVCPL